MPQAPTIDERSYAEIAAQTEQLAQIFAGWQPPGQALTVEPIPAALLGHVLDEPIVDAGGQLVAERGMPIDGPLAERIAALVSAPRQVAVRTGPDLGWALIRVFARMAEHVVARVNQAPDKNFVAFLDLIGTRLLPPQPARVPLTFALASGSPVDAFVPARTQVAAPAGPGVDEVTFETERDLVATRAQLVAAFVRQPDADRYADNTAAATGAIDAAFAALAAGRNTPIEHSLLLAHAAYFAQPNPKTLTLTVSSPDARQLMALSQTGQIEWSIWSGGAWSPLSPDHALAFDDPASPDLVLTFASPPIPAPLTIGGDLAVGYTAGWLRARLLQPLPSVGDDAQTFPPISRLRAGVIMVQPPELLPDQALTNSAPAELSKDVFPFGERPRLGDALYLLSRPAFRPGAAVTVALTLSNPNPAQADPQADAPPRRVKASADLTIAWEVLNGAVWQELARASVAPAAGQAAQLSAATFTADGQFTLALPAELAPGSVGGVSGTWLRARIVRGNYGVDASYLPTNNPDRPFTLRPASFAPPLAASIRLGYTYRQPDAPLQACLSYNDFHYLDCTAAAGPGGPGFTPFTPSADTQPALYLGFDQAFANRSFTLYAQVEPVPVDQATDHLPGIVPARVAWEYSSAAGWRRLGARDETRAFAERGLVSFVGPPDLVARSEFGQRRFWLRARWEGGQFPAPPRLRRVLTNTIWASQAITLRDEMLGSSDGNAGQRFSTARGPVLPEQQIDVFERETLSPDERAAVIEAHGADAIAPLLDAAGQQQGAWVRWSELSDFYGARPRDRCYVIDHLTGELRFGDGQHGMIPPAGRDAVRAHSYRTGGGGAGDRPVGSVTQLKSAIPYIDAVTNHEAASGGADQETLESVKQRGPRSLRHGDRAVTAQDMEDLAHAASPDVARALALPPRFDPLELGRITPAPAPVRAGGAPAPTLSTAGTQNLSGHLQVASGQVELVIVPRSGGAQPVPSLQLIDLVTQYVLARTSPSVDLRVSGPDWVEVTVVAEVVPVELEGADAVAAAVVSALERVLHPLTGGDGSGWSFGRRPYRSDLYALIEGIPGVDHVRSLRVEERPDLDADPVPVPPDHLDRFRSAFLVYSGEHRISILAGGDA